MEKRPLAPDDIYNLKCFGDAQVSPDGRTIAYVRQYIDKEKEKSFTDIFLIDAETKTTKRLTNSGKDHSPRWSPDGRRIAFVSDRSGKSQIWVIEVAGGEAWRIPTKEKVQSEPVWSPDGKRIFFTSSTFSKPDGWIPYPGCPQDDRERAYEQAKRSLDIKDDEAHKKGNSEEKKPNEIKVITRLRYRMDGMGYFGDLRRHVFYVLVPDLPPGEKDETGRQLTTGDYDHGSPSVSPDGRFIALAALRREDADYLHKQDIWLFEVESGKGYLLYDSPGPVSGPKWSPDGKYISFLGHDNARNVSTRTDLFILPVNRFVADLNTADGAPLPLTYKDAVNLTGHLDKQAGGFIGSDIRYGGMTGLIWDGPSLYFSLEDHGTPYIYKAFENECTPGETGAVNAQDASCRSIVNSADHVSSWTLEKVYGSEDRAISGFNVRKGLIVFQSSTPKETENLFLLRPGDAGPEERLTFENDEFMAGISLGDWTKFQYKARDGQELDGWLICPAGFDASATASSLGRKYPLVVLIHGGPHGAYGSAFMFGAQIFAGRGYAVAYFNPRGSTSYGQEFMACIDGDWGNKDYTDIMDGVEEVLARGFIDEHNIFVHGWSYGGYMTTWIVTQTSRFKAACSGAPVTDLHSDYGTSDIMWADEHEYGGKPWEKAGLLLSRSAISHVTKVTTPILMLHGENDLRCPVIQSEEFYVALRRLGKTAVFVRYPGEFHGLKRPLHRIDRYQRMIAWFEYYRTKV